MAARPPLGECLEGVPPGKLGRPCKDIHLCELSLSITNWRAIAPFLGLSKVVEEQIERDEGKTDTQKIAMLRKWREKFGRKATYRRLATVFWKLERADLIDAVCDILVDGSSSSDSEGATCGEPVYQDILQRYTAHLRHKYVNEIPNTAHWPPPPTYKDFNLAMIRRTPIQRIPVSEDYIRQTQMGKVDDIMLNKTSIDLKDIFKSQPRGYSRRNIVLIEGAPGAGKSTLAWHVSKSWALGLMHQDFTLVVFVQLRDPAIGSAMSIADILPGMSNGQQREVVSKLETRNGKGVLFILDGWDEYPTGLRSNSICGKLVCHPGDLSMQESTLLITSRPVASGELQEYCTTRIEIVGFTPAEVSEYFREALREAHQDHQYAALQECLEVRPVIRASCYLPMNAAIVVHLFITKENTLPTSLHSLFTTLILNCIVRHLKRETVREGKRLPRLKSLDHIPVDIQPYFNSICALAFHGVMSNKASFSEEDLHSFELSMDTPEQLLSLIQGWSTVRGSWEDLSYSFFHLSVQELLAAYHIHKHCSPSEQEQIFWELFYQPRFAAVLQFYAAFSKFKLEGIRRFLVQVLTFVPSVSNPATSATSVPAHKTILDCLYEAQDPSLCQYVAGVMEKKLTVYYAVTPLHCMVLGYFLCCIAPTDAHRDFHVHFRDCDLNEHKFKYFVNELKKCSRGQLTLSMEGGRGEWNVTAFAIIRMLERSCSHCISELKMSALPSEGFSPDALDGFLLEKSCKIPHVSLDVTHRHPWLATGIIRQCDTTGLKTLELWGTELPQVSLPSVLALHTTMDTLELSESVIGLHDARVLFNALAANTTLKSLCLSSCAIPTESTEELSQALARNSTLKALCLSGCELQSEDIKAIARGLAVNSSLESLDLHVSTKCGTEDSALGSLNLIKLKPTPYAVSSQGARALADALTVNTTLKTLDLSGRDIQPKGVKALADSLRRNSCLKQLNLSDCDLSSEDVKAVADSLLVNNSLEVLVLSWNNFGDDGLQHIIQALRVNSALKSLTISCCQLGALHVRKLEHLVTASKSLKILILSGNDLSTTECGQSGAHYLAQGLRQNTSLTRLSIQQCMLTDHTLDAIVAALEPHPSLQEINFGGNQFTANGLKNLSKRLKKACHMQKVTLRPLGRVIKADQEFKSFVHELQESGITCVYH